VQAATYIDFFIMFAFSPNYIDQATVADLQRRLDARDAELREAQAKLQQMEQEYGETTSRLRLQVCSHEAP